MTDEGNSKLQLSDADQSQSQISVKLTAEELEQRELKALDVFSEERERLYGAIQKIADRFQHLTPENAATHKFSLDRLITLQSAFDSVQQKIIERNHNVPKHLRLATTAAQNSVDELIDATQRIYLQKTTAKPQPISALPNVRLPLLDLPHFTGNIDEWLSFHNLFKTTIHESKTLNDIEKFQYLLSLLKGEPHALIKTLEFTPSNYNVAWQLICSRFQNERRQVTRHFYGLYDISPLKSDSVLPGFLTKIQEHTHALATLDYPSEDYGPFLVTILLDKFSNYHKRRFEDSRDDCTKYPTLEEILEFLRSECARIDDSTPSKPSQSKNTHVLHASSDSTQKTKRNSKTKEHCSSPSTSKIALTESSAKSPNKSSSKFSKAQSSPSKPRSPCQFCKSATHGIFSCQQFLALTVPERREKVTSLSLCTNCLGAHRNDACLSRYTCQSCKLRHHTLLHLEEHSTPQNTSKNVLLGTSTSQSTVVALATALVRVKSARGARTVRALLDSAAQSTFITTQCAQDLGLNFDTSNDRISGISQTEVEFKGVTHLTLCSRRKTFARNHPALVIDNITGCSPPAPLSPAVREKIKHLPLADPSFDKPTPIDILIGADLYGRVITGERLYLGPSMPCALGTIFGYTLIGPTPVQLNHATSVLVTTLLTSSLPDLHTSIQKFWQVEQVPSASSLKIEEDPAELFFRDTTVRLQSGRFMVRLPFSDSPSKLGVSKVQAERRFFALEKKFEFNSEFYDLYVKYMNNYIQNGVMTEADPHDLSYPHYVFPHHGVMKGSKIRVVFDASAKTSTGVSLNDLLHAGPTLVNDIRDILLNFRRHKIVFSCDIRQMYLQVALHPDDQRYHLVLWRSSQNQPLKLYKLTAVTFGVTSSPFLAIRSLQQLAQEHQADFPRAAQIILDESYVDDLASGADSEAEAKAIKSELIQLCEMGGFSLAKWTSNAPSLLEGLATDHLETPFLWEDEQTSSHAILGLQWIPSTDSFTYKIESIQRPSTKRGVLSAIATIFDPCGWVSPVVFLAKTYMQRLWLLKIDWDTALPSDFLHLWNSFLLDLPTLSQVRLPRHYGNSGSTVQLHGFCDASESGYAAVLYIRFRDKIHDNFSTSLIIAKSKVAPLQRISLPRLELCGATLLANLLHYSSARLGSRYQIESVHAWSDSTVTLHWVQTPSHKLKTFVANRVSHIQELLPDVFWHHVKSQDNPADCASRGILPSQILNHPLWWNGPSFLTKTEEHWPAMLVVNPGKDIPELKVPITALPASCIPGSGIFTQFSSWRKLQRIIALILRFKNNALSRKDPQTTFLTGPLCTTEFHAAERLLISKIQRDSFKDDLSLLEQGLQCSTRLTRLSPFLDSHGLIRVGGRLSQASIADNQQHPWILPKDHHLVKSLITHYHVTLLHAGPQALQVALTRRFWILSGRSAIRQVIFKCITCFRARPHNAPPFMGDLPPSRVNPSRPFAKTGMDYAGPFHVKVHTLRNARIVSAYWCIFVCMATKAVHIEVAQDLTADSFVAALTRFASRRGNPSDLFSDNGTNFIGASNELKRNLKLLLAELPNHPDIIRFAQDSAIKFHFNPPAAPHQGGLWEAAVKSSKYHLARVLKGHTVTLDEFTTLSIRIEAMLNSRPITALSTDPMDLAPLSPGHFLVGGPLTAVAEPSRAEPDIPILRRWHRVQAMAQSIWRRWSHEYLQSLQSRSKWTAKRENLKKDDLVLIHDPSLPPLRWKTGRVIQAIPGKDNIVRVASVKTSTGELVRPCVKLFPLPI